MPLSIAERKRRLQNSQRKSRNHSVSNNLRNAQINILAGKLRKVLNNYEASRKSVPRRTKPKVPPKPKSKKSGRPKKKTSRKRSRKSSLVNL